MKNLFTPVTIGGMSLKNRLVVPAMATQYCTSQGEATPRYVAYHEAKAKGGWGLIITENYAVTADGGAFVRVPGLWNDQQTESHRAVTQAVHRHGAKICCQIYHAGRAAHPKVARGQTVAPSAVRDFTRRDLPRALDVPEIHNIVLRFGDAAQRARQAGFDMVELHGAHGYLISQFLSGFSNKRGDAYGGSLHNRCRFLMEIIEEVRGRVGPDFPLQLRLSAVEYTDGGLELAESQAIARMAEACGIHSLHVSQGHHAATHRMISPSMVPPGAYSGNAAAIKAVVQIPVIGAGRINDPLIADALLASGSMDLVAMGRASLADPELPNKAAQGRLEELHHCFGCLQGCAGRASKNGIRCFSRPELGREGEHLRAPSAQPKRILVAGGGIAGCEAAILAAQRGHQVSLWEQADRLGGQWHAAAVPPGKAEFQTLLYRQAVELRLAGVAVHLGTPVTEELLRREQPEVLLAATGSLPLAPPIPGVELPHVVQAIPLLLGQVKVGRRIVIIGGGLVGAETANFAAQQGAQVTIVEQLSQIAGDGEPGANHFLLKSLADHHVQLHTTSRCLSIRTDCVEVEADGGTRHLLSGVDQVVLAVGMRPYDPLSETAARLGIPAIPIGAASSTKDGMHNLWEAFDTAATL